MSATPPFEDPDLKPYHLMTNTDRLRLVSRKDAVDIVRMGDRILWAFSMGHAKWLLRQERLKSPKLPKRKRPPLHPRPNPNYRTYLQQQETPDVSGQLEALKEAPKPKSKKEQRIIKALGLDHKASAQQQKLRLQQQKQQQQQKQTNAQKQRDAKKKGQRIIDAADVSAEAEGRALQGQVKQLPAPEAIGKRITKIRNQHERGSQIIETKIDKRYMED